MKECDKIKQLIEQRAETVFTTSDRWNCTWGTFRVRVREHIYYWDVFHVTDYVEIGTTDNKFTVLLDSELRDKEHLSYYKNQLIALFDQLVSRRDLKPGVTFEPIVYCKNCHKRLYSLKYMIKGCGPECSKRRNKNAWLDLRR